MDKRALRRHHTIRIRDKRLKQFKFIFHDMERDLHLKRLNMSIDTPKPCSCFMCGNPRKHWNEETLQEMKSRRKFQYEVNGFPNQLLG